MHNVPFRRALRGPLLAVAALVFTAAAAAQSPALFEAEWQLAEVYHEPAAPSVDTADVPDLRLTLDVQADRVMVEERRGDDVRVREIRTDGVERLAGDAGPARQRQRRTAAAWNGGELVIDSTIVRLRPDGTPYEIGVVETWALSSGASYLEVRRARTVEGGRTVIRVLRFQRQ